MSKYLKILIIIPTLNEEKNIKKIFLKIHKLKKNIFSILFIDDNSTDKSQSEIIKLKKNIKKFIIYFGKKRVLDQLIKMEFVGLLKINLTIALQLMLMAPMTRC